jgi:predicted nucleic acid-binding protein
VFLVDTCVLGELGKGGRCDPRVARWYERVPDQDLFTSVLVIGEIQRGLEAIRPHDGAKAAALEAWLVAIRRGFHERIIPVDLGVAISWGSLDAHGTRSILDGLLAATALGHDLVLVTRNVESIRGTGARYLNPFEDQRVRVAR